MLQLSPKESFTIVRQLEDHTDSSTNYVQAVIRNAKTDALLATVNLTDQGSRRFSKAWQVPADVSGFGFWITILTSVYTDSGYTTKNQNYGDKMDTYLVQDRPVFNPNYPVPTGAGADVDYKRIRKIVNEEIKAIDFPPFPEIPTPEKPEKIDFSKDFKNLRDEVSSMINGIKIPQPEKIDPILSKLDRMEKSHEAMMAECMSEVMAVRDDVASMMDQAKTGEEKADKSLQIQMTGVMNKLEAMMSKFENTKFQLNIHQAEVKPVESAPIKKDDRVKRILQK